MYQALQHQSWKDAEVLLNSGDIVKGKVESYNRGGIIVTYLDLPGFVPASHVVGISRGIAEAKRRELLESMVGKDIDVRVIEVDRQRHRLVLSQRAAQRSIRAEQKDQLIGELYEGQVLDGTIINVRDFGAFVLLHNSQISEEAESDIIVGNEISLKIVSLDVQRHRVSLSLANSHMENQESTDAKDEDNTDLEPTDEVDTGLEPTDEVDTDLEPTDDVNTDLDSSAKGGDDHDESDNKTE